MELEAKFLSAIEGRDDPEPQRARDETDDYDKEVEGHQHDGGDECNSGDEGGGGGGGGGIPKGPQTGVKGVLNEKKHFDREEAVRRELEAKELLQKLKDASIVLRLDREQELEDEFAELEDDDFMKQYQDQRMKQLVSLVQSRPTYGELRKIHVLEYVEVIDQTPKEVPVVIHLYQEHLRECRTMNRCLEAIAKKYIHATFVKIVATDADEKYDDVALPTLLIYHGGNLAVNITHAVDELSDPFETKDVEDLLLRFQAIQPFHAGNNISISFEKSKHYQDD